MAVNWTLPTPTSSHPQVLICKHHISVIWEGLRMKWIHRDSIPTPMGRRHGEGQSPYEDGEHEIIIIIFYIILVCFNVVLVMLVCFHLDLWKSHIFPRFFLSTCVSGRSSPWPTAHASCVRRVLRRFSQQLLKSEALISWFVLSVADLRSEGREEWKSPWTTSTCWTPRWGS